MACYAQLVARAANNARFETLVGRLFAASARTFIRHLRVACPGLPLAAAG